MGTASSTPSGLFLAGALGGILMRGARARRRADHHALVLPVVSLAQGDADAALALRRACVEYGFFYLDDHGIPAELSERVFAVSRAFFALPQEQKLEVAVDENHRGFSPASPATGVDNGAPEASRQDMESFFIGRSDISAAEAAEEGNLQGPNQWPEDGRVPGFRETMEQYVQACRLLGLRLCRIIALALGFEASHFDQLGVFREPMLLLRALHYLPRRRNERGTPTMREHTDYGMVTLLALERRRRGPPALEVQLNGAWVPVPCRPRSFVCNLGDMLQTYTNGLFKSTKHRVCNRAGVERYSIPVFFEPDPRMVIAPIVDASSQQGDDAANEAPVKFGEHLARKHEAEQALRAAGAASSQ